MIDRRWVRPRFWLAVAGAVVALGGVAAAQPPACVTAYGTKACGFDCVAAYGDVQCARTLAGACLAAYGKVVCNDPPPVARWRHHRRAVTKMSCKAAYGEVACGYSCLAAYGMLRCAQTPEGVCTARAGQVECQDPERPARE